VLAGVDFAVPPLESLELILMHLEDERLAEVHNELANQGNFCAPALDSGSARSLQIKLEAWPSERTKTFLARLAEKVDVGARAMPTPGSFGCGDNREHLALFESCEAFLASTSVDLLLEAIEAMVIRYQLLAPGLRQSLVEDYQSEESSEQAPSLLAAQLINKLNAQMPPENRKYFAHFCRLVGKAAHGVERDSVADWSGRVFLQGQNRAAPSRSFKASQATKSIMRLLMEENAGGKQHADGDFPGVLPSPANSTPGSATGDRKKHRLRGFLRGVKNKMRLDRKGGRAPASMASVLEYNDHPAGRERSVSAEQAAEQMYRELLASEAKTATQLVQEFGRPPPPPPPMVKPGRRRRSLSEADSTRILEANLSTSDNDFDLL
jgi:hypothetical protein